MKNLFLAAAMLLPAAALAAPTGVTLTHNNAITTFHGVHADKTLPKWLPPKGKIKIFDTLGKGDAYNDGEGWTISNPASEADTLQWFAYSITPKSDVTVTEIVEGVGYVTGTDSVTVALLADDNGVPGSILEKKVIKTLETFGDCCGVAVDHLRTGVKLTAGTTYWIGCLLPSKKEKNTWDAWNFSSANTSDGPAAYYTTSGWTATQDPYAAFAVYGE